ncbi:BQ2448_6537 [Microbotryum intermedium]|uniref:BQ2448_6537 protein n=1 Tax=Microbotryum intermedium TaxID=269621 RepID=A0A238FLS1_9BASI|nr:BQ2448_6537 [Microbotryum intermedium]
MSNLIPSTFRTAQTRSQSHATQSDSSPPLPSTDCDFCRLSGTATFALVSLYAFNQARKTQYGPLGKTIALIGGSGFLAAAIGRWNVAAPKPDHREDLKASHV